MLERTLTDRRVVSREEWATAREELLAHEKQHTRSGDELARRRRELPWVRVEKEYTLQTADGQQTLADLFDGRSQLVVYHFMFGPSYEAGCPTNSSIADSFDGLLSHLEARDVTMICTRRTARITSRLPRPAGPEPPLGVGYRDRLQRRPGFLEHGVRRHMAQSMSSAAADRRAMKGGAQTYATWPAFGFERLRAR